MTIIYDDLTEFAEVRLRCEGTRKKSMCKYCPFFDRCQIDDDENLHVMCCDILPKTGIAPMITKVDSGA